MSDFYELKTLIEQIGEAHRDQRERQQGQIDEMKTQLDDIEKKAARPFNPDAPHVDTRSFDALPEAKTLRQAVSALLAGNQAKADDLFQEAKAMSAGTDPDGGYVVHPWLSSEMTKVMEEISPLYRLARRVPMATGAVFEEPIDKDSAEAAWVGETGSRGDTDTPQLGEFRCELHEVYAMPKATQKLIDVASIDVMAWLTGKIGDAFAVKEGSAFHTGDGVAKPRGILTYPIATTSDATRAWGTIQYVPTGASGAFHTTKADPLIDLVATLKPQYRNGARWLMNRKTESQISKMKEATSDAYIWQQSLVAGVPNTLLGYPVEIDEDMPDPAADSLSVAFGNFAKAYTIPERPGAKYLTDPYTDKPNVRLYAYRRVGGGLNNSEAIKFLKFATS